MIDGLSVPDALALALCFGTVVVGGICWLRTTVTPEEKRNPKQTQSAAIAMKDIQNRAPRKNRDLGLEDLECALKEAELSEMLPSPMYVPSFLKGKSPNFLGQTQANPPYSRQFCLLTSVFCPTIAAEATEIRVWISRPLLAWPRPVGINRIISNKTYNKMNKTEDNNNCLRSKRMISRWTNLWILQRRS